MLGFDVHGSAVSNHNQLCVPQGASGGFSIAPLIDFNGVLGTCDARCEMKNSEKPSVSFTVTRSGTFLAPQEASATEIANVLAKNNFHSPSPKTVPPTKTVWALG
jgi:hypothetical protein